MAKSKHLSNNNKTTQKIQDVTNQAANSSVTDERTRYRALAKQELKKQDPVIGKLIDENPGFDPDAWRALQSVSNIFEALLYQIIGQQISVSAMTAIYTRFLNLFPANEPDAAQLAGESVSHLRSIGLSNRKAEYVIDLAKRVSIGELDGLERLTHEEAKTKLISFRGIGAWTADGALLMAFGWDDVLVSGDLVLRKAVQQAYGLPHLPSEKEVEKLGECWRPHRSLAASYLFIAVESGLKKEDAAQV